MSRGRAYNRRISETKAKRKKKIAENGYFPYYEHLHQYSKNKIHCSCPMCATKTNLKKGSSYTYTFEFGVVNSLSGNNVKFDVTGTCSILQ